MNDGDPTSSAESAPQVDSVSLEEKAKAAKAAAEEAARVAAEALAAAQAAEEAAAEAARIQAAKTPAKPAPADAAPAAEAAPAAAAAPAPVETAAAPSPAAQEIAAGYAFEGAALELGTVIVDGVVDPAARVRIPLATINRHGLVAGATGTGKTKTLQGICEQLSAAGVPVVMADVKGDVSGLVRARRVEREDGRARRLDRHHGLGADRVPCRVPLARHRGHRHPGAREHHQLRADPAEQGAGAQRNPGVHARADLPLGGHPGPRAARPQGPALGHRAPDLRRGQGRSQGHRRGLLGHRGRDPARAGQPGGGRRRHLLRRAGARDRRPAAGRRRTARASSRSSSWPRRRPAR